MRWKDYDSKSTKRNIIQHSHVPGVEAARLYEKEWNAAGEDVPAGLLGQKRGRPPVTGCQKNAGILFGTVKARKRCANETLV